MPIRKFNYTNRQRIKHADVRIKVVASVFSIEMLNLENYELPDDALVFVEPYLQRLTQRVHILYGTVGNLEHPTEDIRRIDGLHPLFVIKIVGHGGRIFGQTSIIRPDTPESAATKSLLPVERKDIGSEAWRVSFYPEIVFQVHEKFMNWEKLATSDYFLAFVYPSVLREILSHILLIEEREDIEGDDSYSQWLRFGKKLAREHPPEIQPDNKDDIIVWIDKAVRAFARKAESLRLGKKIVNED